MKIQLKDRYVEFNLKAGTIFSGGNTVLVWYLVCSAIGGNTHAQQLVTDFRFWLSLLLWNVASILIVTGYRAMKAKFSLPGGATGEVSVLKNGNGKNKDDEHPSVSA